MKKCFLCMSLIAFFAHGVEETPWFAPFFEFQAKSAYVVETMDAPKQTAQWIRLSLSNAFPESWGVEAWAVEANTSEQEGSIDHLGVAGAYQMWDQLRGDVCTMTAKLAFQQAFAWSLRDIASFHHGKREMELLLSMGRECFRELEWTSRWFTAAKIGIAEQGSPWIQAVCGISRQWENRQQLFLRGHYLVGLGRHSLQRKDFTGYGEIAHRSVEIYVGYTYAWDFLGQLHLAYARRIYAKNFPRHWQQYFLQFIYPFGL